jgi:hypothetical protein
MSDKNHYVNRKFKIQTYIFEIQKYKLTNFISQNRSRTRQFFMNLYSGKKIRKGIYGNNRQA